MSIELEQKEIDLFKQKEKEYIELSKQIDNKKNNFQKKYKKSMIDEIKQKIENIKRKSEDIKARVEQYEKNLI